MDTDRSEVSVSNGFGISPDEPTERHDPETADQVLDGRIVVLTDLAAAVAVGADLSVYRRLRTAIVASGVSRDDVLGSYVALAPMVGTARLIAAAPSIAHLLGYDIDADLERPA